MKKTFVKVALMSVAVLAGFALTSCSSDDNNSNETNKSTTITVSNIQNENAAGTPDADSLFVTVGDGNNIIAVGAFVDGACSITLPEPSAAFLESFGFDVSVTVTPADAKVGFLDIHITTKKDGLSYLTYFGKSSMGDTFFQDWVYVDKDVVISGDMALTLKKGWNLRYVNRDNQRWQNEKPDGLTWEWVACLPNPN